MEAMEDSLQLEWSTKTFDTLSQLLGAFSRPRASTNPQSQNPPQNSSTNLPSLVSDNVQPCAPNLLVGGEVTDSELFTAGEDGHLLPNVTLEGEELPTVNSPLLHMLVKLDISNISVFICDSAGGR